MDVVELKNCPLCAAPSKFYYLRCSNSMHIKCINGRCGISLKRISKSGNVQLDKEDFIKQWNTRLGGM